MKSDKILSIWFYNTNGTRVAKERLSLVQLRDIKAHNNLVVFEGVIYKYQGLKLDQHKVCYCRQVKPYQMGVVEGLR